MKFKKKYIWAIAVLLIVGGGYFWFGKSDSKSKEVQYVTATAEKGTLTSSISASGNVIVDDQATVDPTITGTVADLTVQVGDSVTKGQYLFSIINDDLSVSVAKASASYESAKNSLESAEIDKDNAEATYDKAKDADDKDDDAYTKKELLVLKDKIELAEAKIIQSQKSLDASLADYRNTQADASKRKVTVPISGTINEINIKNGDDLSRTSSNNTTNAPIIIGDLKTLKALVEVNEVDISKISIGQKVMLKFDALDSLTVSGKVEKVDALGTVTQGVVTYNVTISFDTLDERIKPQMSVSSSIITDVRQDVLIVPSSAVKNEGNSNYVELLNNGKTPEQKVVQIGGSNGADTEIVSGINVGDKVVTQTINSNLSNSSQNSNSGAGLRIPGVTGGSGGLRTFGR
jgi:RND family efflux transporter MFP subunit